MRSVPKAAFGTALIAVAGCATAPSTAPTPTPTIVIHPYYVREGMVYAINPPTEAIWNLQVEVMDDYGNFDPALMTDAHWASLDAQSALLLAAAQDMAVASSYASHNPAGNLGDAPEGTDLAAIQGRLAANPQGYNAFATGLADHADQLFQAVKARDTELITRQINDMQPVCKACHVVFWYPEEYR